jgi:AraC-like DNA-binding protein
MASFNPCESDVRLSARDYEFGDLALLYCGREKCEPGHSYGPDMRSHYVFHLILSGNGMFKSSGKLFHLSAGQGFMLYPETQVYYSADIETPWEYIWVGFSGRSAARLLRRTALSPEMPVMQFPERFEAQGELMRRIVEAVRAGSAEDMMESYGLFLEFLSNLAREKALNNNDVPVESGPQSGQYVERAKDFIRENLSRDITASDVARSLGLNRSYFCKIFAEACGRPPSRFIAWYRLNTAWHLLHYTSMPIAEISEHVGYNDPAYFTRCFTKWFGRPPRDERGGK